MDVALSQVTIGTACITYDDIIVITGHSMS